MELAIVSTTIHGEQGYLAFDRLAKSSSFSQVKFVISGDKKSSAFDTDAFECDVKYLNIQDQGKYKCSEPMGWNKIMRRNTALLRAIESKPDFILIIDDDNVPQDDYFDVWYQTITNSVGKIAVPKDGQSTDCWHNYLKTSDADIEIYPRGYPVEFRYMDSTEVVAAEANIANEKIGLYQGISLGDPDIDAITRIVYPKPISDVKEIGYCCKNVWSPYNTQNTMFAKAIFPLAFVWPHCGRYDDIYSSFAWQQFLFNNDMYAYVGQVINTQDRGHRDILKDFNNEVEGYNNAVNVWESIKTIKETGALEFIKKLAESPNPIIGRHKEFMLAYLEDLNVIMS